MAPRARPAAPPGGRSRRRHEEEPASQEDEAVMAVDQEEEEQEEAEEDLMGAEVDDGSSDGEHADATEDDDDDEAAEDSDDPDDPVYSSQRRKKPQLPGKGTEPLTSRKVESHILETRHGRRGRGNERAAGPDDPRRLDGMLHLCIVFSCSCYLLFLLRNLYLPPGWRRFRLALSTVPLPPWVKSSCQKNVSVMPASKGRASF